MNLKPTLLSSVIFGLCLCLTAAADDEAKLIQENPDWHFTTEVYTNPPYGLVPTNVWFRLGPLSNGKWAWTTNQQATWFGDGVDLHMDWERERQIKKDWDIQWKKQWLASLPPGVANVEEYRHTSLDANRVKILWQGVWAEDTNTGWRVLVRCNTNTNIAPLFMSTCVGSLVTNSGAGLLPSPDGKFARLQLMDASGKVVPTKKGAALKLYEHYGFSTSLTDKQKNECLANLHEPSAWDASVERDYPAILSDLEYPRWRANEYGHQDGSYMHFAGFTSNGPPCIIGFVTFNDIFAIKTEGDYTLIVQPVLFRQHFDGGTFQGYLDRVDLPSVTTQVHLVPNAK